MVLGAADGGPGGAISSPGAVEISGGAVALNNSLNTHTDDSFTLALECLERRRNAPKCTEGTAKVGVSC